METKTNWCASFDIGKKNMAFYVEEFDPNLLADLIASKSDRYLKDGTPSPAFKKILSCVCNNGSAILLKNSDITQKCDSTKYLDPETFYNLTDLLDQYKSFWDRCEVFVIEQQVAFKGKQNTMAIKLGQHCFSYFCIKYGKTKQVIEFPSYHKTQVLGAPKIKGETRYKVMTKTQRKRWSVDKATDILINRNDFKFASILTSEKKKDDIADCITMFQSWKLLHFVDKIL
jgi:hypothetical protein